MRFGIVPDQSLIDKYGKIIEYYTIGNRPWPWHFPCNYDYYTILEIKVPPRRKGYICNSGVLRYSTVKKEAL